jgi:hypothetical protein
MGAGSIQGHAVAAIMAAAPDISAAFLFLSARKHPANQFQPL